MGTDDPPVLRALVPAPPPVSLRPSAHAGPPVPDAGREVAVSRSAAATAGAASTANVVRRSALADATADIFRADDMAAVISRKVTMEGQDAMPPESRGLRLVRPPSSSSAAPPSGAEAILSDARQLDELVDAVVDRIERRVVDELERRGRRHDSGVF
jgi:hypothetical protein